MSLYFPQNVLNNLISNKLKKIIELQNSIELDKLNYKKYDFEKVSLPSKFLRDIYTKNLSIEDADNQQSDLYKRLNNLNKGRKSSQKVSFLKNVKNLLKARGDVHNSFKSDLFPIVPDTTPYSPPRETSTNEDSFINEIMNDEKSISKEIFNDYFRYRNPSFLAKDLIKTVQSESKQILKQTIDSINDLKNSIIKREISVNENLNKVSYIVEKILEFNSQQKRTRLKILTPKQMLQR